MAMSQAVGEGDTGLNTGGMGAYSPAPVITADVERAIMEECVKPTVAALKDMGRPFVGVLFGGFMVDGSGKPKLLEYNIRFGDPECQCLMKRLRDPGALLQLLTDAATGELAGKEAAYGDMFDPELTALVVVMAAKGYPGAYEKGTPIRELGAAGDVKGVTVFHAGTRAAESGEPADELCEAAGGSVLGVTAASRGGGVTGAQRRAYEAVDAVDWPEGFVRRDIGWRAVAREEAAASK